MRSSFHAAAGGVREKKGKGGAHPGRGLPSPAPSEIALELFLALTDAVAVQGGMLVINGNTYFQQVQELVGLDSAWTHYHRLIAGIDTNSAQMVSNEVRGVAALRFYQETVKLLRSILYPMHRKVIEQSLLMIDKALSGVTF